MLHFVKNAFRGFMNFILWINLILFTIGGGILGYILAGQNDEMGNIIGFGFLGIIIGLLINIVFGGLLATIINIDKNLQLLKNKYVEVDSEENNIIVEKDWICKKCYSTNRKTALFCNSCGEKKIVQ